MKKLLLSFLFFFSIVSYSQTLLETVNLPAGTFYSNGYGLVYENGKYWISSSHSTTGLGVLNAVNASGTQVATINITYPGMQESQGLAFDGTNFWYVDRKTSRCDIFKVSPAGTVLDSITGSQLFGSTVYMGGAGWDGTGLWISVYYPDASAALYKVDVTAKTIVDTISVFGIQPQGITVKGDTLFYVMDGFQGDDEKIYAVDLATEDTLFSFHVPETPGVRQNPRGLAWDGTYFWLLAEPVGASTGRQLFKYDLGGSGTPSIFVPVQTINFPNTTVGNTANYNLTIYSDGSATLTVDSISVSGSTFSINPISFPLQIPAGNSSNVTVNFDPINYAFYQGTLTIYCDDPVNPTVDVDLSGHGLLSGARIGLTATSHNFGNVWVGEGVAFWDFNVFNMGDQSLEISGMQFNLPEYTFEAPSIPFQIVSTDTQSIRIFFYPTQTGSYLDTLKITNNDVTNPLAKVSVQGMGTFNEYNYGYMFWNYQVPPHPNSPSAEPRVEGLRPINDITGDGIPEVIISTENYWTMCLDGAASGNSYPIWIFTTYMGSNNTGSIGANFEYGVQDAIQIANDLNGDGFNDVVIATGGGNESVYALDGTNGLIIWYFGDDINYSLGDFEAVDVQRDFNGDNVEDVLAIADGNDLGTGYKKAILFNGTNGNIIWEHYYPGPNPAFGKTIISINDINGDSLPDAVIAYGNNGSSDLSVRGLNGTNGQTLWTRNMIQWEPKELLEMPLPGGGSDVIAAEYFSRIHRLNGNNGSIVWTYPLGASAGVIQIDLIQDINSDQIPDVLIASFAGNGFNCLSGADGTQLWSSPMDYQFAVTSIPDIDDDGLEDVVVGDRDGIVHCFSGKGDSLLFSYTYSGGDWIYTVHSTGSIDGNASGEILVGTTNGKVTCFSGGTVAVPVELTAFNAYEVNGSIFLNWSTATEVNNYGFEIERKAGSWEKIGFVPGSGTTTEIRSYSFVDENVPSGMYCYRLRQVDYDGRFEYSDVIEIEVGSPNEYSLEQNYPNPFNPATTINYSLRTKSKVELKVFDILGEEVASLVNEEQEAGVYRIEFDASTLASGIYFYTLTAGDFVSTKKMVLLK